MIDKAIISELSHWGMEEQKEALPDMPYFIAPDELQNLLRLTRRKEQVRLNALSFACIAKKEANIREFAGLCRERKYSVRSVEEKCTWLPSMSVEILIAWWKSARRKDAATAGGVAKGRNGAQAFWEGFYKIKDRWHLPSTEPNQSKKLLKEAKVSRNTLVNYIGYTRLEWRKLSEKKRGEVLKRVEKEIKNAKN